MINKDEEIKKVAEGFYQNAYENNLVTLYQENLKFLVWNFKKNPEYFRFLCSPFVDYKDKVSSLDETFKDVIIPEILLFSKILIERKLIINIEEISNIFESLAIKDRNILEGVIYTPFELSKEQIDRLSEAFYKKINQKVLLKQIEDKSLIAGIRVLIDGTLYELSVSSRLEDFKDGLVKRLTDKKMEESNNG